MKIWQFLILTGKVSACNKNIGSKVEVGGCSEVEVEVVRIENKTAKFKSFNFCQVSDLQIGISKANLIFSQSIILKAICFVSIKVQNFEQ